MEREEENKMEIKNCDELKEKREMLHMGLSKKLSQLCAELKKRGFGDQYGVRYTTEVEIEGQKKSVEIRNTSYRRDSYFYMRADNTYYVSQKYTPTTNTLIEGIRVLKAVVEKFNKKAEVETSQLEKAEKALAEVMVR